MPQPSRRPARGAPPRRGGGGGGNAAYVVAGLFVVGIIVALVVVMSGDKKPKPPPAIVEAPPVAVAPPTASSVPPAATPPPFPPVDPKILEQARAVAKKSAEPAERAKAIYDEAMKARKGGDDALWQKKLLEADELLTTIQDEWNEVIQQMPSSKDYDEEEVANHYLGKEGQQITKALMLIPAIKKSLRLPGN
jgi:hypothetical protein